MSRTLLCKGRQSGVGVRSSRCAVCAMDGPVANMPQLSHGSFDGSFVECPAAYVQRPELLAQTPFSRVSTCSGTALACATIAVPAFCKICWRASCAVSWAKSASTMRACAAAVFSDEMSKLAIVASKRDCTAPSCALTLLTRLMAASKTCSASFAFLVEAKETSSSATRLIGFPRIWAAAGSVDTDLSFLSFLELYGTEIAERRMPARRVVEALDVVEHI